MKRRFKRTLALVLSLAMIMTSSMYAFAANGTVGGEAGDVEGWVNKKVFSVLVPTASANALKMLVDPQKLIRETDAAAKSGLSKNDFEDATVLFPRTTGNYKYAATSESISMANVGTVSVNYAIEVGVTELGNLVLSDNKTTINNTTDKAVLFVEMQKGNLPGLSTGNNWSTANATKWTNAKAGGTGSTDAIVISQNKTVSLSADVATEVKKLYKVSYNSTDGYTYGLSLNSVSAAKAEAYKTAAGSMFSTQFAGTTNNGDLVIWKNAKSSRPVLSLTYTITALDNEAEDQPLPGDTVACTGTYDSTNKKFKITFPSGVTCTDSSLITNTKVNGIAFTTDIGASTDGTKISFLKDAVKEACGGSTPATCVFTFDYNGTSYTATISTV